MEINAITLDQVLPGAFADNREQLQTSDVWLRGLTFERGKRYLVSAASGAGKSSLCAYIYGYRPDYTGTISFDGRDIRRMSSKEWDSARQGAIAWMPQEMRLFPTLTAVENIMLKVSLTGFRSEPEVRRMLAEIGLDELADRPARLLSIGQQQRVAAVRALCQPFSFILLDEPVSHLDEESNKAVSDLMEAETARQGAGAIVTSVGNHLRVTPDVTLSL